MKRTIAWTLTLSTALVLSIVFAMIVSAGSLSITFEPSTYASGNIDGQDGWSKTGPYDVAVDSSRDTAGFGTQSLRISNAITSGSFGDWAFSKSLNSEAGEPGAAGDGYSTGPRGNSFQYSYSIASAIPGTEQTGLQFSNASDRGDGARMSYLRYEDHADGIHVFFDDYRDNLPFGSAIGDPNGCATEDDFAETDIATLDRAVPHTIRLTILFVPGPRNDVVKVYVDGVRKITGTTWEDYFRYCEGNPPRTVDSLLFQARSGGGTAPATSGNGFLVDNLAYNTANTPANANDCKHNGWQNLTRADGSTFRNQGDCVSYVNTGR